MALYAIEVHKYFDKELLPVYRVEMDLDDSDMMPLSGDIRAELRYWQRRVAERINPGESWETRFVSPCLPREVITGTMRVVGNESRNYIWSVQPR